MVVCLRLTLSVVIDRHRTYLSPKHGGGSSQSLDYRSAATLIKADCTPSTVVVIPTEQLPQVGMVYTSVITAAVVVTLQCSSLSPRLTPIGETKITRRETRTNDSTEEITVLSVLSKHYRELQTHSTHGVAADIDVLGRVDDNPSSAVPADLERFEVAGFVVVGCFSVFFRVFVRAQNVCLFDTHPPRRKKKSKKKTTSKSGAARVRGVASGSVAGGRQTKCIKMQQWQTPKTLKKNTKPNKTNSATKGPSK